MVGFSKGRVSPCFILGVVMNQSAEVGPLGALVAAENG